MANDTSSLPPLTSAQRVKMRKTMDEFKSRTLHSGSHTGPIVRKRKQAIRIGLSQARREPMMAASGGHVLTAAARNRLPDSAFGLPEERKYPEQDRVHMANAKSRASKELHAGKLSRPKYNRIVAKANRGLGAGAGMKPRR